MRTRSVLGVSLLLFLVVGDLWFPPGSRLHLIRLPILAVAALAACGLLVKRPTLVLPVARAPMVFFLAFAILAVAAAFAADAPRVALRYAAGYLVLSVVAVVAAGLFPERTLVRGLLATLLLKVAISFAVVGLPFAWHVPGPRFKGMLGSPNPMGAAAGLAYLLLVLDGWYDWRSARTSALIVAAGLAATVTLAITRSASATAATLATLVVAAPLGPLRREGRRGRLARLAVALALLAPLLLWPPVTAPGDVGGDGSGREASALTALELRAGWWSMLVPAVMARPWLGYGAGSTAALTFVDEPPWGTSAHNLYLEAAVYAGIPAAVAMLLFMAGGVVASARAALRDGTGVRACLAAVVVLYAVLSLVEPVVLNGAPSSLVVPLLAAAVCSGARPAETRPGSR
jgi:O-antigen ligase